MSASGCCRRVLLGALALGASLLGHAAAAHADARAQAELTSVLVTDNLLTAAASAPPPAEDPDEVLAFERAVSSHSGRENRVRLELGSFELGFLAGIETSARLRLELGLSALGPAPAALRDGSSWLGLAWRGGGRWRLALRIFPLDTDYERLGYLHALDWGGSDVEQGQSIFVAQQGGVPGAELGLETSRVALFAGLRWATAPDTLAANRRLWGVTFGGRLELAAQLRADFGLGYFDRAPLEQVAGAPRGFVEGASLRLVWRRGSIEPELTPEPFRPRSLRADAQDLLAREPAGFALALEGVVLAARLRRFEAPEQSTLVPAPAAAAYGSLRGEIFAGHATLLWRSLAFVTRNDPGLVPGESVPVRAQQLPELAAWLGGSATLLPWRLTPSVEAGVMVPAALVTLAALPGLPQTFVVREARSVVALPIGSGRLPIALGRLALRFQASSSTALSGFVEYERDPNRVRFQASPLGTIRTFAAPDHLHLGVAAQSRF